MSHAPTWQRARPLGRRGVAAPDFALSIAAVLLVAAAIFDLGNLIAAQHSLNFGVAKAARYAAVNSGSATPASIKAAFTAAVTSSLGSAGAAACNPQVTFPSGNSVGRTVVISATYAWSPMSVADKLASVTLSAQQTLTIQH